MDTTLVSGAGNLLRRTKGICRILVMVAMLGAIGCGGEHKLASSAPEYPAGSVSQEEIERQLKYDARVQDFEVSGDKLIVNVNQEWVASPPGLQQRALGQWFGMWQAAQSKKGVEVVIRHDGKDVATWSGEKGYKHVAAPRQGEDKGGSSEG